MPNVLEVTADDIVRLSESQLPQLIEQLLQAEKRSIRRDNATIIVSHEVRARDKGIDGEWTIELNPTEIFADVMPEAVRQFIPAPSVIYQCKATDMGAKACAAEVIKNGELKPAIRERLAAAPGRAAYVIACTQKVGNHDRRKEREEKCAEQIQNAGINAPIVRFLDAELLAVWSNRHIATRRFVVRKAGRELAAGVLLLEELGRNPDVQNFPLCTNEELRRFISDIRDALARGTKIIRVTGNSGLGKTRIVYEVFNAILEGGGMGNDFAQAMGRSVVYVDLESKTSVADDLDAVREACLRGDRGIVVIDNCPVDQHEEFAKWFLDAQCDLKLITIDYFEDQGSSRGTPFLLRPELLKGIVPEILRKSPVSQNLSDGAIAAIAEFAQGCCRLGS
jgi:hypothetical protein